MLTATRLFAGATVSDTLAAVLKTEPDWTLLPDGTPAPIRRLLRRCLEKDRKRRLTDAGAVNYFKHSLFEINFLLTYPVTSHSNPHISHPIGQGKYPKITGKEIF